MTRTLLVAAGLLMALPGLALAQDSRPASSGIGEVIQKARDSGALARVKKEQFFKGIDATLVNFVELKTRDSGLILEFIDVRKSGNWKRQVHHLDWNGKLTKVQAEKGKLPSKKGDNWLLATVENGTLSFTKGADKAGKPKKLPDDCVSLAFALFILPSLHEHLPAGGLVFSLFNAEQGQVGPSPFKFKATKQPGEKAGEQKVVFAMHPKPPRGRGFSLTAVVSTLEGNLGQLLRYELSGESDDIVAISGKEAEKLIKTAAAGGAANPAGAIGALKTIGTSQALFREGDKDGDGELDYARNLEELGDAQLIDSVLASGKKQGYVFKLCAGSTAPEFLWMATASPISGKGRHFATNHEGVVYYKDSAFELDTKDCAIKGGNPVGK